MSSQEYEVERIVKHRNTHKGIQFLVKWKGYDDTENTWEPAENLEHAQELVDEYWQRKKGKKLGTAFAEQHKVQQKPKQIKKKRTVFDDDPEWKQSSESDSEEDEEYELQKTAVKATNAFYRRVLGEEPPKEMVQVPRGTTDGPMKMAKMLPLPPNLQKVTPKKSSGLICYLGPGQYAPISQVRITFNVQQVPVQVPSSNHDVEVSITDNYEDAIDWDEPIDFNGSNEPVFSKPGESIEFDISQLPHFE